MMERHEEREDKLLEEREKLLKEREDNFAQFYQALDNFRNKELSEDKLNSFKEKLNNLYDSVLLVDMNAGISSVKADRRIRSFYWHIASALKTKHIRTMIFTFIAGVILTLIPSFLYMNTLKANEPIPFKYSPNAIADRKPYYIHLLKTQAEVDALKKTGIYLSNQVGIGGAVRISARGLGIFLKRELALPRTHIQPISSSEGQARVIDGYNFVPNALHSSDPSEIEILENNTQVEAAKADPQMTYKDQIEVGGGIVCLKSIPCYAIPKSILKSSMRSIKPLKPSTV